MRVLWLAMLCLLLGACGGGSGSNGASGDDGNVLTPEPAAGTARLTVGTLGPAADSVFYAAQFTLRLPAGASLPTADGSSLLPDGVLAPAVSGSYAGASFLQPAGAGSGPLLLVNVAHPGGLTVGPLATLTCQVAAGAPPTADAFTLESFSARDGNGVVIPGITARLTLQTQ
ncbi:hypothetical protein KP003_12895 [Geomonas nitrogeniifigens]|uniref:Lipoprotein n=1 Tax=Geomonas diazotrophica TaxID=2843197 RepID=A0ABX8JEN1_9BACT|nr:hypothetical protein [Geomonas nitrogeniifigens]QWV96223.1 hypothetical protein KP005_12615 [Geomonas nitrogeniifigens]QXE85290.1 hypothetical protein KP003_12895 [Geomonas nitrogeniifigens]